MERRDGGRGRCDAGGIAELARLVREHGPAIDYDLMTLTRFTIADLGGALSWGALRHFLLYLPRTSATSRELRPTSDEEMWANGNATAAILADIYDAISQLNNNVVARGTGRAARQAKPYRRPWRKPVNERQLGRDPIPVSEFEAWWAEHA